MEDYCWCIVLVECPSMKVRDILVDFYSFMDGMLGVKGFHFIVKDRVANSVVLSFRFLLEKEQSSVVQSKIRYRLKQLVSENSFTIDPNVAHPFYQYVAWFPEKRIEKIGLERFNALCKRLSQLSRIAVDMAKERHFSPEERVELAHFMSWILGCTEYGILSAKEMQVGYYDQITDQYHAYLRQQFPQSKE